MSTWTTIKSYRWTNFVQFWLLPPVCVLCRKPGQPHLDLCVACAAKLPRVERPCPGCALPLPPGGSGFRCGVCLNNTGIAASVSATQYEDPVSSLITAFKYHQHLAAGRVLTALLATTVSERYQPQSLPQLLVPVPLHKTRLRERGYNQSLLIARDLSQMLGIPVMPDAVHRQRATPTQQGLAAKERRRNLRGAFVQSNNLDTSDYQRIALIDDVVTTMSTVTEIARVLRQGVEKPPEIHVWCLARA